MDSAFMASPLPRVGWSEAHSGPGRAVLDRDAGAPSRRPEASLALGVAPDVAAHDTFGFLPSDAACGTRTRCGRSSWPPLSPPSRHPLRPIA
eukprot:scaffold98332_cov30-Phaeocystis_antarctica.AAC.1